MRTRWIVITSLVLGAVALGWRLRPHDPGTEHGQRSTPADAAEPSAAVADPNEPSPPAPSTAAGDGIDSADRERFNAQAREFFAQAPALPPDEARRRAQMLSQELSRIERAGGLSAGETFLLRAGLIRATEPDEQRQAAQLRALKERYEADSRQRSAQSTTQAEPMFQLYKVREGEIAAEVMSLRTIPDGLSRDEYLRRRLQQAREQLLGDSM
jgi:hypothetical protein